MGNPTLVLAIEGEVVKEVYAAINRNDISATVGKLDPEIERAEPPEFYLGGSRLGVAAVRAHLSRKVTHHRFPKMERS